jgi:multidrug efflux system outer membrane protein
MNTEDFIIDLFFPIDDRTRKALKLYRAALLPRPLKLPRLFRRSGTQRNFPHQAHSMLGWGSPLSRQAQPMAFYPPHGAMYLFRLVAAGICILFMASCADLAGPKYQRPDLPEKTAWSRPQASRVSAEETIRPNWWTGFDDPYLNELIDKSIHGNYDLKILAARIELAGASVELAEAARLPQILGGMSTQYSTGSGSFQSLNQNEFIQLNWEIDIWGKLLKGVKSREAEVRATEADWRAGYLSLVSSVASQYFQIRQFDEQIASFQRALDINAKILSAYEQQYREGLIPETQVLTQKAETNRLQRGLLDLKRLREVAEFNVATLLGIPAGNLHVPVANLTDTVRIMEVPGGLPSDLLARRPDIIAQEYRVLEAYELTGQARLARLPSVTLTGAGGHSTNLLSSAIKAWTFGVGPNITIPIFDPSIQANIKANEALTKAESDQYRKTVITAFEEVETALANLDSRKNQKRLLEGEIQNLETVRTTQLNRLQEGQVSYLQVLENERTLLNARLAMLQIHQQILTDTLILYKALGGGWPKEHVVQES